MQKTYSFSAKKLLSLLLSAVMVFTAVSVGIVPAFAEETYDDAVYALAEALNTDVLQKMTDHMSFSGTSSGSGTTVVKTNTTTITLPTYADFLDAVDLLQKLDAAVKLNPEYKAKAAFANDGASANCINAGELEGYLAQSVVDTGLFSDSAYTTRVKPLFDNIFSMNQVQYRHNSTTTTQRNVPSRVYDDTVVRTSDYQGYLAMAGSLDDVSNAVPMAARYRITMSREGYKGGLLNLYTYYHTAINTANGVPTVDEAYQTNATVLQTLNAYNAHLDTVDFSKTYEDLLDMVQAGTLDAFYTPLQTKYDEILAYVGSEEVFGTLFTRAEAIQQLLKSCVSARDLETSLAIAAQWRDFQAANPDYSVYDYGAYDYDAMSAAYREFVQIYAQLEAGGDELLRYLNAHGEIDLAYYTNFTDNVKVYDLAALAAAVNPIYDAYHENHASLSPEEQEAVYAQLHGYVEVLPDYSAQTVATIFPAGYDHLITLDQALYCDLNEFVAYFAAATGASYADVSTDRILEILEEIADGEKLAGLDAFYADLQGNVGADRAAELLETLVTDAHGLEDRLLQTLADRFSSEIYYAKDLYDRLGAPTMLDTQTFVKLRPAFVNLEDEILDVLTERGETGRIDPDALALYWELYNGIYAAYKAYRETYGFSAYEKTELDYAPRAPYADDAVKTQDYNVTEGALLTLVEKLDAFLLSDEFKALTDGKDLSSMLEAKLKDAIFTDQFINTVVYLLYPLISGEFEKVWAELPMVVDGPLGITVKVNYQKKLADILGEGNLNIYPQQLSAVLPEGRYAETREALAAAKLNWKSAAIYDRETDALTLDWGVDAASPEEREAVFYQAFADAMTGLKALVLTLFCNRPFSMVSEAVATGSATLLFIPVTLNVNLHLTASPNSGYANALVPVYELLGADNIPSVAAVEATTDLQDIARAILEPLISAVGKIGEKPVDTILGLLPSLVYAIAFDMIPAILGMLKTDLAYNAKAVVLGYEAIDAVNDSVGINVGEMLDLKDLGLDLSKGLGGLLSLLGVDLPSMDEATLATLATLTKTKDTQRKDYIYSTAGLGSGKAYALEADKADVAYFLLEWAVNLLKDGDAVAGLLGQFLTTEEGEPDVEKIGNVLDLLEKLQLRDTGDVIAALTELLNPDPDAYTAPDGMQYLQPETPDAPEDPAAETPEAEGEDLYTDAKAQYLADHLPEFINDVLTILGVKIAGQEAGDLQSLVNGLLSSLYKAETANSLATLLRDTFGGLELPEALAQLGLLEQLGLDPTAWDDMSFSFADGNKTAFKAALIEILTPLQPLLGFLLADRDLQIDLHQAGEPAEFVTADGFDGYSNGVVPLLEALGAKGVKTTSAFLAAPDSVVKNIVNPLFTVLDAVEKDPNTLLFDLIPNVLYYLASDGLNTLVENVLFPVNVLLDVIRPVYSLNLYELLGDDLRGVLADPITFLFVKVEDLLKERFDADFKFDFTAESLLETLDFGAPVAYASANGATAYRVDLEGANRAAFVNRILDYVINEIVFGENYELLADVAREQFGLDDESYAFLKAMLSIIKNEDQGYEARMGFHNTAMATVFWIFFGADSVTDATADYFYRYKNAKTTDLILAMMDSTLAYIQRAAFLMEEVYREDAPHAYDVLLKGKELLKPFYEYTPEDISYVSGVLARIYVFFHQLIKILKKLFHIA